MRPVLQNMLAAVNGGAETAFIIKRETLRELLLELKEMCNPAGQFVQDETPVICKPNRAGAGFTLSVDSSATTGTHVAPYFMDWDETTATAFVDTWSVDAQPEGNDGVEWGGPRLIYNATSPTTVNLTALPSGDTVEIGTHQINFFTRTLTFSSTGALVSISAEERLEFPVIHTYTP